VTRVSLLSQPPGSTVDSVLTSAPLTIHDVGSAGNTPPGALGTFGLLTPITRSFPSASAMTSA
jgi:hypothetical protein